jgi:peroxiredoxin
MNPLRHLVPLYSLMALCPVIASPVEALNLEKSYQAAMATWAAEMRAATTPAQRAQVLSKRPDTTALARKMWATIGSSLDQEWTLAPAAWFLRTTPTLLASDPAGIPHPIFSKENEAIRKAIELHHLNSPKLAPICSAFASAPNPRSLALLEKIQSTHPDQKIQGLAALGAAMQLKVLGDSPDIMPKRLTYLRKAIIQSSEMVVDGTTVAKLAEDEIYIIRNLTKGRTAPDLVGVDSGNRPLSLSSFAGKVVVLTFWNSNVEDAQRVVEMTTALQQKFKGRPLVVLGVNNDAVEKLRALEGDGTVPWKSFSDPDNQLADKFRVALRPVVYVLDGERKIQYTGTPGSFVELTAEALLAAPEATKSAAPPAPGALPNVRLKR